MKRNIAIAIILLLEIQSIGTPVVYASTLIDTSDFQRLENTAALKSMTTKPDSNSAPQAYDALKPVRLKSESAGVLGIADMAFTQSSAAKRLPIHVQKLGHHDYKADEKVTVSVANPDQETLQTKVLDSSGKEAPVLIDEVANSTTTEMNITQPNQFKPGKYTVVITDNEGTQTKQDFTWGVLALNPDQSSYQPGDQSLLSMAVLDEKGAMVCDADVTLAVTKPDDTIDTLSTANGKITVNKECHAKDYTLIPDYEAHYTLGDPGIYATKLTAHTGNGSYTIEGTIVVQKQTDFVIKRTSATRLYPQNEYPMNIDITANRDFQGVITETVPESFTITPGKDAQSYDDMNTMYLKGRDPAIALEKKVLSATDSLLEMPFNGSFPVSQGFGAQVTDLPLQAFYAHYGLAGHDGVDFALPMGTALFAVDDGTVVWAGPGDYGITVIIQHKWGKSYYGHLSRVTVTTGMALTKGAPIGYSGNTGESTGPHLHFGIKPNNPDMNNGYQGKINPLPFLPKQSGIQSSQSLSLAQQSAVLAASTSADDATPTPLQPTPTPTPTDVPLPSPTVTDAPSASNAANPTASDAANTNFTVNDDQIKQAVQQTENPVVQRVKVLQWNVTLKKGQKTTLSYTYKAPLISPQFYTVGPLKFFEGNSKVVSYQEGRTWQIAADAIGVGWYDYYWLYRKQITIDHTKVPNTTQTDFPVLINLTSDPDLSANAQANGNDILFTDSTGKTKLSHEIESYSAGTLVAWVKVPSVSSTTDTSIYMYYGNSAATNQQSVSSTWSNGYVAVWHFKGSPSTTCSGSNQLCDSTSNANNGGTGGSFSGVATAGKIGNAWTFIAPNDSLTVPSSTSLNTLSAAMTVTAWMYATNVNDGFYRRIISRGAGPQQWFMERDGSATGKLLFDAGVSTWSGGPSPAMSPTTWYYVSMATSTSPNTARFYFNNILESTGSGGAIGTGQPVGIGADYDGTTSWNGRLDEIRLSNVARSADWTVTEYNNQNSPTTFSTVGGVETKVYAATMDQLLRHGEFFDSTGVEQPFLF